MKKLYALLVAMLITTISSFAGTITFDVNIGNVCTLSCYGSISATTLAQGKTRYDRVEGTYQLQIPSGYAFAKVTQDDGTTVKDITSQASGTYLSIYTYSYYLDTSLDNVTYTIQIMSEEDARTATLNVDVDDASKVYLQLGSRTITLSDGQQDVKFNPNTENRIFVQHKTYGSLLTSITYNSSEETPSANGNYIYNVTDGSTLKIVAKAPEVFYTLKFEYATDDGSDVSTLEGIFTSIKGNGEDITDFDKVQHGTAVVITPNSTAYKLASIEATVGGSTVVGPYSYWPYNGLQFTVTGDAVVKVKAHKYGDLNYTLNADHPEYFTLHKGSYYSTDIEELVEGENKLTIPESEYNSYVTIVPNDNCYITSILVNDEEKFVEDSKYTSVTITEGTAIEVKSDKYIDASYKLTFKYENDGEGFISDVKVNGVSVADPHNPDGIYIKAGATVDIYGNSDDYKFNSMSIGDKAVSYFNQPTEFVMKGETEVTVDATKYATFSITVNVDNPDNFTLYKGYSADATKIIPLKAGANKLDLSTNLSAITFIKNSGCYFTSVKVSGNEQYYQGNSSVYVYRSYLSEGTVIDVTSGAIVRDKNLVIYVNDKSLATYGMGFTLSDYSSIEVESGYNSFNFADSDLPINFYANGQTSESVYLNDEAVAPNYSGSTARTFNALPDNSVIKVFFNEVPETHAVSVTVPAGVTYTIVKDLITKVDLGTTATKGTAAADTPSFNVLGKTHIDITVKADADHTVGVKVNNEAVEAVDGVYSFDVDATTAIEITSTSGISDLTIEGNATFDVYNLQGIRVAHGVSDFNNLPAGIYIANGKKVVVR